MKLRYALLITALSLSAPAFQQDKEVTDPQIAGIVVTANQIDVDTGKLAKSRAKSSDVKQFAEQMITDHTAVNQQAAALARKLNVTPQESGVSKSLRAAAQDAMNKLKGLKGAQFDKAYVDHEVAYHQQVLDAIDSLLIPKAQNAELKDLITKVRPAIQAHLDHARHLQSTLKVAEAR